jgi:hypothetical protein
MTRVLIACERSGVVRRAFEARGHEAWSCDMMPADDGSNHHITGDVRDHLADGWDMMAVMHPPCTRLCNSGVRWLYIGGRKVNGPDPAGWASLEEAARFYRDLRDTPHILRKVVENPAMHIHAKQRVQRGFTQFVQPWWFGDPYFKATGLELINLPMLFKTNELTPPKPGTPEHKEWSKVHRAPPSPDRARLRSETFPGLAGALADQHGGLLDVRAAA